MKKIFTYVLLLSFGSASFISCGTGRKSTKGILGGTSVGGAVGENRGHCCWAYPTFEAIKICAENRDGQHGFYRPGTGSRV